MTKKSNTPLVSVGMPIYNEGAFLGRTLDSLLAQDFEDFELIISDNASDDSVQSISNEYLLRDSRIRYYRNNANLGAIRNFNRVFELSSGKYFMWASGHDLWSKGYISSCVEVLERDPTVVLCSPTKAFVDRDGRILRVIPNRIDTRVLASDPVGRLLVFLWGGPHAYTIYGLIRSSALRATGLFRPTFGPDLVLLAELSLMGCVAQIYGQYHYRVENRSEESLEEAIERYRRTFFGQDEVPSHWFPFWSYARELLLVAKRARLSPGQKVILSANVLMALSRLTRPLINELIHMG